MTLGGQFRNFGKYALALAEDGRHVRAHLVVIAVLVPGLVVEVADIGIIRYRIIELKHRVLRLPDVQFIKVRNIFRVGFLFQILGQTVGADKLAAPVHRIALRIEATQSSIVPCLQITAVPFHVNTCDTNILQGPFQVKQFIKRLLAVDKGTILHP